MEEIKEKKEVGFAAPNKKVILKPVMRPRSIQDPKHEAFFLFGNAKIKYTLPKDRNNNFINPFTSKAEQAWLEKELDADLNIYKTKDNFWRKYKLVLGKDDRKLDLNNPKDYLDYIVARTLKNFIAPSGQEQMHKRTYRYALVEEDYENEKKASKVDQLKKAYMHLGKMESSKSKMVNFLKVYGTRVDENSKTDFLITKLGEIVENDLSGFLKLIEDPTFDLKTLIADGVAVGAIHKVKREYLLPGGDKLSPAGIPATIENVCKYLQEPANQDILDTIKARVNSSKD